MSGCISYVRSGTAAPCGGRCPAAGFSIKTAGGFITRDVFEPGLILRHIQRGQREALRLQWDKVLGSEVLLQHTACRGGAGGGQ